MKYIKIIDDFDNEEVCIVKTSLSTKELQRRINQHDSSHAVDVYVDYDVVTGCYKDLESIILRIFDSKRYRNDKDFFDCDIKKIRTTIKKINNILSEFKNNCDVVPKDV